MSRRLTAALPVSLLISLLHVGCCLFPLIVAGIGSFSNFHILGRYKPFFSILQIGLLLYLGIQLISIFRSRVKRHDQTAKWSYLLSFAFALGALVFGIMEPLQTEQQQLAKQRFEYFKNHGRIQLTLTEADNETQLLTDLKAIEGVRPATIHITSKLVSASFRKDQTSEMEILSILKTKGYHVEPQK
ncbi:hypothetical protein [Dyadobacter alkalitolerans]|uniref:hypothetical protein n=1 Tax=Dyadobacter alkalitolerans TaxID=492736 RepID=UPI00047AC282|nr:hypothetical protein [Dyadobacter alkalitolerans]